MKKIAITTSSFGKGSAVSIKLLKDAGLEPELNTFGRTLKEEEIGELYSGAIGVIAGTERLTEDVLRSFSDLKVISRCGTGMENVDLETARELGIMVFNTPNAPVRAVSELTLAVLLNLLRKVGQMDRALRDGRWEKQMGNLLFKKRIGIIGFGRIGRQFVSILEPFRCEIRYFDPNLADGVDGRELVPLDELLTWADIVSVHACDNKVILGSKELGYLKKGAIVLNLCRGGVVDETALCERLRLGDVAGAALDVFSEEPYKGPLSTFDNVILTPHAGSYAVESRVEMEYEAAKNLINGLKDMCII